MLGEEQLETTVIISFVSYNIRVKKKRGKNLPSSKERPKELRPVLLTLQRLNVEELCDLGGRCV